MLIKLQSKLRLLYKTIFCIAALLCHGPGSFSQAPGDYGTMSSGAYNASIWGIYNAVLTLVATGTSPSSGNNVFILPGFTVALNSGVNSCNNITIQSGGKLWTANSATNIYIDIYGNIICDGQVGDGATFDGISFNIEGTNDTISGSGMFDASRMRKSLSPFIGATTSLFIQRNVNLRFATNSTTQIYNNAANTIFNVTVAAGDTLNLIASGPNTGHACIDGLDGASNAVESGGTFTIDGTMIISGKLYLTTNNANTTYFCKWVINGLLQADEVVASASGLAKDSLIVNGGGKLELTDTPAFSSLSPTNNVYIFNLLSTVEYSAAGAQAVRVPGEFGAIANAWNQYGHLILSGSGLKTTMSDLYVRNNITITGAAVLNPPAVAGNIFIGGNWTNYNETGFTEKIITVYFNGSIPQNITCPGGEVYYILRYNNSAAGTLTFNSPVDVIFQLVWGTNGPVDLNSNMLTVRNSVATGIVNGNNPARYIISERTDNSSKIRWKIGTGVSTLFRFPFGVSPGGAANYIPVIFSKSAATNVGDVTISTYGTAANNLPWPTTPTSVTNLWSNIPANNTPDNRAYTVDRFWQVDATIPVTADSLRFTYRTLELPTADPVALDMHAQYWDTPISYWNRTQFGNPWVAASTSSVTVNSFNVFNTAWTLTSIVSPLPIELLNFEARQLKKSVLLTWETASEINNDFFTIERSSDGEYFYSLGNIGGAGNSVVSHEYQFSDESPLPGVSYYRLRQTDFDGNSTLSRTIGINRGKEANSVSVFPIPAHEKACISANYSIPGQYVLQISNMDGQIVKTELLDEKELNLHFIDLAGLSRGVYSIIIRGEWTNDYIRLVIE